MQLLFIASQQYKLNVYFQDFMPILLFICIYMGYIGETGGITIMLEGAEYMNQLHLMYTIL